MLNDFIFNFNIQHAVTYDSYVIVSTFKIFYYQIANDFCLLEYSLDFINFLGIPFEVLEVTFA